MMKKSYNNMLTLSLHGGGLNNTLVCLKERVRTTIKRV